MAAPPDEPAPQDAPAAPTVNRKKQKRRQKAAAKAAAELAPNGHGSPASVPSSRQDPNLAENLSGASEDEGYAMASERSIPPADVAHSTTSKSKRHRKKKKKAAGAGDASGSQADFDPDLEPSPSLPAVSDPQTTRGPGISRDKIWSTSNHEERERIKEFWLGLGEDERKSLVKVEKDAVLKKMKEQQKHTCSCTVCGRKRNAIEEELEGLYDAYYLELEQFANQGEGPPMLPPPRDFPIRPPRGLPAGYAGQPPSRGRIVEHVGDDVEDEEELDEVYSEDEVDDDEYSDDEPPEAFHSSHDRDVADFLTFGNSLQVKGTQLLESLLRRYGNMELGGILTVADDLLKNDGKRFIEMMEQLAERRMAREEDAREHFSRGYGHPNGSYSHPHNHPPPEDDDYEDDEEEEEDEEDDYEDSQDEEYEDEEVFSNHSAMPSGFHTECCCQDQMTEEQRMEEGRRMFQIFAARMFEQRVLSAYKEKVAKERQQRLLEELEEESRQVDEQKAKKAKNAQKKKDKAAQRKQALAEEKARKEAEKAADEAARAEAEARRIAEQKQKNEEKRKQKEAQRKAEEEARLKKEAERLRRVHEQREKQAEQERKAREAKEREKKAKEEQRLKEKEVREQREREAQERKDKQERDKREKEARAAKAQRSAQEATEAKNKAARDAGQKNAAIPGLVPPQVQVAKRGQQHPISIPTALPQHPPNPAHYASPKVPVATPALPMAPTPVRARAPSQHDAGFGNDGRSPSLSSHSNTPAHTSPGSIGQERKLSFGASSAVPPGQSVSPPGMPPYGAAPFHGPPLGMQQPSGLGHHASPGFANRMPQEPVFPSGLRPPSGMMMSSPGINSPAGRGMPPGPMGPPGFSSGTDQFSQGYGMSKDVPLPTHARQGSFEGPGSMAQPIGRPAPIGRPGSTSHGLGTDEDEEAKRLGSRALLEDDEPLEADLNPSTGSVPRNHPPGLSRGFPGSPFLDNSFSMGHNPWGPSSSTTQGFPPPGFGNPGWGAPSMPPGFTVGSPTSMSPMRSVSSQPRHVAVRLLLCKACKDLSSTGNCDNEGFTDLSSVRAQIEAQSGDNSITAQDLMNLCDTEGSPSNGGGTFDVRRDATSAGKHTIRWVPDAGMPSQFRSAVGAPGEIGSPLAGYASMRGI